MKKMWFTLIAITVITLGAGIVMAYASGALGNAAEKVETSSSEMSQEGQSSVSASSEQAPASSLVSSASEKESSTDMPSLPEEGVDSVMTPEEQNLLAGLVLKKINGLRTSPLQRDASLEQLGHIRAYESSNLWSHTRPDGTRGCDIIGTDKYRGENLAKTLLSSEYPQNDGQWELLAQRIVDNWMASSTHKDNILDERYGCVGIYTYAVFTGSSYRFYTAALFSQ